MSARKDPATLAVEEIADAAIADLEVLLRDLDKAIARALGRLKTDDKGRVLPRHELANLTSVRGEVLRALERAGVKANGILAKRVLEAAKRASSLADIPEEFHPDPERAVRSILEGRTRDVARAMDAERDEVVAALNLRLVSGSDLDRLVAVVAERGQVAIHRAQALIDTGVIAAGRAVVADAAENANADGLVFVMRYVGPLDSKTRPFCRPLVGDCFTQEAIAGMDNGQGLDVREFCGGYNCRHGWAPLTVEAAKRRGLRVVGI